MKNIYTRVSAVLAASALLFGASAGYSQNDKGFSLLNQTENFTAVAFDNPDFQLQDVNVDGQLMTKILTEEGSFNLELGAPALPYYTQSIVMPNEGAAELQVTYSDFYEIQNVEIAPSKGNLYRNIDPADVPYEFGPAYSENAFYPEKLADMRDPFILREYRGMTIITYPYQYNPVTKVLRVYEDINVSVVYHQDQIGINELTTTPAQTTTFNQIYPQHFLNYDAVVSTSQSKYTVTEEEGSCLVIGPASLQASVDQIVEWKNRLGIPCEGVDVATIGNTDTQIKTYIENYYASNPDLVFVIIVGDHAQVNTHTYGTTWAGEEKWSDSYYGQMTGDYYPELFVGRYSGSNNTQIQTMIDRQVEYELQPVAGDHWSTAIGVGSDEGAGTGDDGEADWQHLRNIRTELLNFGMTEVHEFYDGSHGGEDAGGDPSSSMISNAVDAGATLFNYTGHGDIGVCITGNYNTADVNAANNNGMYPFVVSVACSNGEFTYATCLGEAFIRASNGSGPTGGIAFCGSSILMSWAPPMETQDEMTKILTEQYPSNKKVTLGGLFFNSMMSTVEEYGSQGNEVMQTWVLFGDPAVMIRTDDFTPMNVSHYDWCDLGTSEFWVNCDIDGADITISQAGEIIGTGVSAGGGVNITFNNPLTTDDYLVVTATKYNHDGYVGTVQVGSGTVGIADEQKDLAMNIFPNPAKENAFVSLTVYQPTNVTMTICDLSGKVVAEIVNAPLEANDYQFEISTSSLEAGVYLINVNTGDELKVEKLTVIK